MAFQSNAFQANAFQLSGVLPTHKYDTGLAKPQRTLIRDAIVARLAPLLKTNGGYLQAVIALPKTLSNIGEDDIDGDGAILYHALNSRSPAVAVALGQKTYEASGTLGTESRASLAIEVYVVSQHARAGLVEGRLKGDAISVLDLRNDPGIDTMLEHLEQFLVGADLGIDTVAELRPTEEDELGTYSDITVWRQRYEVDVERIINPARAITQLLLEIQGLHTEAGMAAVPAGTHSLAPLTTLATLLPEES